MATVIVQGWRSIPHSYATVNQFQCLELLKRGDVTLYHRDMPFGEKMIPAGRGLFDPAREEKLRAIPAPPADLAADVTLRMVTPYRFEPSGSRRTFVFGTVETGYAHTAVLPEGRVPPGALERADIHLITPSRWSREGFIRSGADPGRVHIIPHGVDPEIFRPPTDAERQRLRELNGLADEFVFLSVGAMTGSKGIGLLLKAFAIVSRAYPRARLVLKGLDALYQSKSLMDKTLARLGEDDRRQAIERIHYLGDAWPFAEMARLYQLADAYVSPYFAEGFNLPVLEAAACGVPVICTARGSTDDFTNSDFCLPIASTVAEEPDKRRIRLVPDPQQLVAHMMRAIEDRNWMEQARRAGPAFVHANFSWQRVTDQLCRVMLAGD